VVAAAAVASFVDSEVVILLDSFPLVVPVQSIDFDPSHWAKESHQDDQEYSYHR
jgi:hypothetical protein